MGRFARTALAALAGLGLAVTGTVAAVGAPVSPPLYSDCATVSANLVLNCGFEDGGFDGPNDWVLTPASSGSQFGPVEYPHSGSFGIRFGAYDDLDDQLSQTIAGTQAGVTYVLGYWLDDYCCGDDNHFSVTVQNVQGGGSQTFDNQNNSAPTGWTYYQDAFVAGATAPTVVFAGYNASAYWFLDDVTIQAGPLPQTVAFTSVPPVNPLPGDTYLATATGGSSGEPIVFATDPHSAGCQVSRAGLVSFTAAGTTCRINASQAAAPGFAPATTVQQRIVAGRYPQTITITSTPPAHAVRGTQFQLTATGGGSGNPVVFSTNSPVVCTTTADGLVSFLRAGQCVILANQAASTAYTRAKTVRVSIVVNRS